jgi:hypothetical protein
MSRMNTINASKCERKILSCFDLKKNVRVTVDKSQNTIERENNAKNEQYYL